MNSSSENDGEGRNENAEPGRKKKRSIRDLEEDEREEFFEIEGKRAQQDEKRLAFEERNFQAELD